MARGRMISKTLSTSKKFATLHASAGPLAEFCQILFTLIVAHADDFGRLSGDTFTVKFAIVPASPRTEEEVGQALDLLRDAGLLRWDGATIQVENFDTHQSGLHKRTQSMFPEIPGNSLLTELNRTELKGMEEKGTAVAVDGEWATFLEAYPSQGRNQSRIAAELFLNARRSGVSLAVMLAALDNHKASEQWSAGKIPNLAKWLDEKRWTNELLPPKAAGTSSRTAGNIAAAQRFVARRQGGAQ